MTEITAIEPIRVHVVLDDTKADPKERRIEFRSSEKTIILNAANPAQMLAGYDPLRDEVRIVVADNPVVLSRSTGQANDAANTTGTLANPNGRILINGSQEYVARGANEVWVSTNTYPTRVGFEIVRLT